MENKFELIGTRMLIGFINFKQILPALGSIKLKTKNNDIIRGKWHKMK